MGFAKVCFCRLHGRSQKNMVMENPPKRRVFCRVETIEKKTDMNQKRKPRHQAALLRSPITVFGKNLITSEGLFIFLPTPDAPIIAKLCPDFQGATFTKNLNSLHTKNNSLSKKHEEMQEINRKFRKIYMILFGIVDVMKAVGGWEKSDFFQKRQEKERTFRKARENCRRKTTENRPWDGLSQDESVLLGRIVLGAM